MAPLAALGPACDAPRTAAPRSLGQVVLALDAASCADHCVTTLRVTLYEDGFDDLPLGPATETACGDTITIADLPPGLPLRIRVDAFDSVGQSLLTGISDLVTVQAGRSIDAPVALESVAPPTILRVSPDPWVAASDQLVIEGTGFAPRGLFGLTLDATAIDATFAENAITDAANPASDRVTASPRGDTTGESLVVTACGVDSTPFPLRVVGPTFGAEVLAGAPSCAGATPVLAAVTPDGNTLMVAWTCNDVASSSLHVHDPDGTTCPPPLRAVHPLGARPTALALTNSHAVVALEGPSLLRVAGPAFTATPTALDVDLAGATIVGAAATATDIDVPIVTPTASAIVRVPADGPATTRAPAFPELVPKAVAATADALVMLAVTTAGDTRLVNEPVDGAATASPVECTDPTAVVASPDGATLALRCANATWLWSRSGGETTALDAASAIVFDSAGDVLFATLADAPGMALLSSAGATVATWPATQRPWLDLGDHRLLVLEPSQQQVMLATPFDTRGPCTEAGGWR